MFGLTIAQTVVVCLVLWVAVSVLITVLIIKMDGPEYFPFAVFGGFVYGAILMAALFLAASGIWGLTLLWRM